MKSLPPVNLAHDPTAADALATAPITPADAEAWSDLLRAIADDDALAWKPTPAELREELTPNSTFDPARQTWAVWHEGRMVAHASVRVRREPTFDGSNVVYVNGGVHPHWRGQGLGSELIDRAQRVGASLAHAAMPGVSPVFRAFSSAAAPSAAELLAGLGYEPARYWFDMSHDLSGTFSEDPRTRPVRPEDSEALRQAHNDAFSTHWGSGPVPAEMWAQLQSSATLRPDLSRIVVEGEQILAYTVVSAAVPGEAYLNLVGVRGVAQGRGLGRVVLTSALAAIQADGSFVRASLDVDADNPSGAGALYSSAGFVNSGRTVTWQRPA